MSERDAEVASLQLLSAVWKHRHAAGTLLVIGVVSQMWVAVLQKYLPGCRLRVIVTECLWQREPATPKGRLKTALMRWMIRRFDRCILYAQSDVPRFSEYFRVKPSKFVVVRFHNTLRPERYPTIPIEGRYVFAGGNSDRDYLPLIEAMRLNNALCLIACRGDILEGIKLPSNVCRVEANHLQFRQLMAGAAIVVLPMRAGLLRSAGQQTFLNAMRLGKVTIVTDPEGAADYITHERDGLLCPAEALGVTIRKYLGNPALAKEIGRMAVQTAESCSVESTYDRICEIARELSA